MFFKESRTFDALSLDGRSIFLTQSVGNGKYWVRAVDVASGKPGDSIVTKSVTPTRVEVDGGPMKGLPMNRIVTADGVTVYTLYDGPAFRFVHALDVSQGGALCDELVGVATSFTAPLRLRFGSTNQSVEVVDAPRTVAQILTPASSLGPSVRIAENSNATR